MRPFLAQSVNGYKFQIWKCTSHVECSNVSSRNLGAEILACSFERKCAKNVERLLGGAIISGGYEGESRLAAPHFEGRKMLRKEERDRRQLREMASSRLSLQESPGWLQTLTMYTGLFMVNWRKGRFCSTLYNMKFALGSPSTKRIVEKDSRRKFSSSRVRRSLFPLLRLGAISSTFFLPI